MNPIFQNMLSRYSMRTKDERTNAIHEIMQQITLTGLYKAAFYGSIVPQGQYFINRRIYPMDRATCSHPQSPAGTIFKAISL